MSRRNLGFQLLKSVSNLRGMWGFASSAKLLRTRTTPFDQMTTLISLCGAAICPSIYVGHRAGRGSFRISSLKSKDARCRRIGKCSDLLGIREIFDPPSREGLDRRYSISDHLQYARAVAAS